MNTIRASKYLLEQVREFDAGLILAGHRDCYPDLRTHALALRAAVINGVREIAGLDKEIAEELKQFSVYGPGTATSPLLSDQEVFDIVINNKLGTEDGLTIWPAGVNAEQYDRVMDMVDKHLDVRDIR